MSTELYPITGPTIALVGCGSAKAEAPTNAGGLYESTYFAKKRAFADLYADEWGVISGGFFLVHRDQTIPPYEWSVKEMSTHERNGWRAFTQAALRERVDWTTVDDVLLLLGQAYETPLWPVLETVNASVHRMFAGTAGNGEQMGRLSDAIIAAKHGDPVDPTTDWPGVDEERSAQSSLTDF